MTSRRAVFGLGTNLGDRLSALQRAVDVICAADVRPIAVSPVVETAPDGGPAQPDYLNAVLVVDSELEPAELLAVGQSAEVLLARTREVRWGARTLDVDLLVVGDLVSAEPDLTLPHPRAHLRGFVLAPWAAADPEAVIPGHGRIDDLLRQVDVSGVRVRPDLELLIRS